MLGESRLPYSKSKAPNVYSLELKLGCSWRWGCLWPYMKRRHLTCVLRYLWRYLSSLFACFDFRLALACSLSRSSCPPFLAAAYYSPWNDDAGVSRGKSPSGWRHVKTRHAKHDRRPPIMTSFRFILAWFAVFEATFTHSVWSPWFKVHCLSLLYLIIHRNEVIGIYAWKKH